MAEGFGGQAPGGESPRTESVGEAQVRWASWLKSLFAVFGVRMHPYEEECLAKSLGCFIRRWPSLGKWKAPPK